MTALTQNAVGFYSRAAVNFDSMDFPLKLIDTARDDMLLHWLKGHLEGCAAPAVHFCLFGVLTAYHVSVDWFDTRLTLQTVTLSSIYYHHVAYLQFCHLLKKQQQ